MSYQEQTEPLQEIHPLMADKNRIAIYASTTPSIFRLLRCIFRHNGWFRWIPGCCITADDINGLGLPEFWLITILCEPTSEHRFIIIKPIQWCQGRSKLMICCDANMAKGWMPPFNRHKWQELMVFHLPLVTCLQAFSQTGSGFRLQLHCAGSGDGDRRKIKRVLLINLLNCLIS